MLVVFPIPGEPCDPTLHASAPPLPLPSRDATLFPQTHRDDDVRTVPVPRDDLQPLDGLDVAHDIGERFRSVLQSGGTSARAEEDRQSDTSIPSLPWRGRVSERAPFVGQEGRRANQGSSYAAGASASVSGPFPFDVPKMDAVFGALLLEGNAEAISSASREKQSRVGPSASARFPTGVASSLSCFGGQPQLIFGAGGAAGLGWTPFASLG